LSIKNPSKQFQQLIAVKCQIVRFLVSALWLRVCQFLGKVAGVMKRLLFVNSTVIIQVMSLFAWQSCTWYADDILGGALPAGCSLLFYGTETQPAFTIVAGCPGKDLVRL
jgi:hypothetical protein